MSGGIETSHDTSREQTEREVSQYPENVRSWCQTHKDKNQFHAGGAPVPLSGRQSEDDKEGRGKTRTGIPESLLSCTEAVGLGCADWQPDDIEEKVKHHEPQGELEDSGVPLGCRVLSSRKG